MGVSMKSKLRNLLLICCFMLFCQGIRDAQAQHFSTASSYILTSNTYFDNALSSELYAIYLKSPSYLYNAYSNMYSAYSNAYQGYYYSYYAYVLYGTPTGYYCQLYAYYDYLYKSYANTYLYYNYLGYNYTPSIITNSYY